MTHYHQPQTAAGAIIYVILSVFALIFTVAFALWLSIIPLITNENGKVSVTVQYTVKDCFLKERWRKNKIEYENYCNVEYRYFYDGKEYTGTTERFWDNARNETVKAIIDPTRTYRDPEQPKIGFRIASLVIFIILMVISVLFIHMYIQLYKEIKAGRHQESIQ